jgi:hypothetical protein
VCNLTKKFAVPFVVVALLAAAALACGSEPVLPTEAGQVTSLPPPTAAEEAQTEPTAIPEATSTPTPEPTATPRPTDTPAPTDTPTPPPEPVTLAGTGDSVVDVGGWQCAPSLAHITGNADVRHFAVENFDAGGERLELLVNTTDAYDGCRPLDWMDDECTSRFQVTATGDWSITLLPLAPIPEVLPHSLAVPGTYAGDGDDVILLVGGGKPDLANVSGNEAGRHFALMAWSAKRGGDSLLVNTTDPYQGTVMLDETTMMLEVVATGAWTIEVTAR